MLYHACFTQVTVEYILKMSQIQILYRCLTWLLLGQWAKNPKVLLRVFQNLCKICNYSCLWVLRVLEKFFTTRTGILRFKQFK